MYIRTSDGIYELKNNMSIENAVYSLFGKFEKTNEKHLFRNDKDLGEIINQADTIEKLCDEFVLDHPIFAPDCKTLYHSFEKAKKGIDKRNDGAHSIGEFTIYGAIWTDKGLIYVAKMNNKGELELI